MTQGTGIANLAGEMIDFIAESPTMFHSTLQIESMLSGGEAMTHLDEAECWSIEPGRGYVVTRGGSSLVAFKVGRRCLDVGSGGLRFQIVAVHADSPAFKLKNVSEAEGPEGYLRLDVEAYGGMIDRTWFDRPLAIAGRVLVREDDRIESRLVDTTGAVAIIPSLAIHLDRESNSGFSPNRNVDLRPIISAGELGSGSIDATLAESIGVEFGQIVSRDLFVYNNQPGMVWGISREFLSSPRIDDLAGAYCAAKAFGNTLNDSCVTVLACFDNEEVGSNTKQGAMSTFLRDTLSRVTACLCGEGAQELPRALSRSMLVSCDNAHAVHPNHPEKHDELNRARLNGGIVVKEAANQRYCTDAFSRAIFQTVCERAGVSFQTFANRSDMAGGSTLGNLSNIQVSMHAVDVGIPQLAMHSAFETMGARDVENTVAALEAFYAADIRIDGASSVEIR